MVKKITFYARSKRIVYVWEGGRRVECIVEDDAFYSVRSAMRARQDFNILVQCCGDIQTFTQKEGK
jgi:hypothetical protein